MALHGICEHESTPTTTSGGGEGSKGGRKRPLADLWLSMMSACGEDEAKLAHLYYHDQWDENGLACDDFDEEDDDDDIVF
jgi:hypothetical protein